MGLGVAVVLGATRRDVGVVVVVDTGLPARRGVEAGIEGEMLLPIGLRLSGSRTIASMVVTSNWSSGTLAAATSVESGRPWPSTWRERFTPPLPRSVGLGPTWPPFSGLAHRPSALHSQSPRRDLHTARSARPQLRTPRLFPPLKGRWTVLCRETPSASGSTGSRFDPDRYSLPGSGAPAGFSAIPDSVGPVLR